MGWGCRRARRREAATALPEPTPAAADADFVLERLRESYAEVLQATKHEDDKVGRFLAAIAFLVAGALLFVEPTVLAARFDLGDGFEVRLPAIALVAFLVTILLAVLLYVLSTAAPVTAPPRPPLDGRPSPSLLFFLQIATETTASWTSRWLTDDGVPRPADTVRSQLTSNYIDETLNLAQRADSKRNRSVEASVLFAAALLFFGLAVGWTIDVYRVAEPWAEPAFGPLEEPLRWTTSARLGTGAGLVLFALMVLYLQLRRRQTRVPQRRQGAVFVTMGALVTFIVLALTPVAGSNPGRVVQGLGALGAATFAGLGFARTSHRTKLDRIGAAQLLGGVSLGSAAALAIVTNTPSALLLLAVIGALSPLNPTLVTAFGERARRLEQLAKQTVS